MRSWLADCFTGAKPKKLSAIPIAPSLYSLSNEMGNSLLAVRGINHKYIVVEVLLKNEGIVKETPGNREAFVHPPRTEKSFYESW